MDELPGTGFLALVVIVPIGFLAMKWLAGRKRAAEARARPRPTRMRVEFALVEDGLTVVEDAVTLTEDEASKTYSAIAGDTSRTFTITYAFALPSSRFAVKGPDYEAALAMGVHRSDAWETIALGDVATLRYKRTPEL